MALSGSFSGSIVSGNYALRVDWTATQSIANNTSTVTAKMYLVMSSGYSISIGTRANTTTIDGKGISYTSSTVSGGGTVLLGTVSRTISHNSNGTKTFKMSSVFNIQATINGTYYGSISASSSTITLDTIPRASSFTIADSTIFTGGSLSISISRASTSFTHTVKATLGSYSTQKTSVATSTTLSIPLSWVQAFPNASSMSGSVIVYTYSGSTLIGSSTKSWTAYVPTSVVPSFTSLSVLPNPGYFDDNSYVQGRSAIKATINGASGVYGSTIKSYSVTTSTGYSGTKSTDITPIITQSGNVTVTGKITDSRGKTASKSVTINFVPWSAPILTDQTKVYRVNAQGEKSDDGNRVLVHPSITISESSGKNQLTVLRYRYQQKGSEMSEYFDIDNNSDNYFDASVDYTYDVYLEYKDIPSASIVPKKYTVYPSGAIIDVLADGSAIALGGAAERPNMVDVRGNWGLAVEGNLVPTVASGTWTPASTAGSISSISNSYFYKVGRLVKFNSNFNFTSVTSSAIVALTGLPHRAYSTMIDVRLEFSTASNTLMVIRGYLVGDQITFRYQGNTGSTGNLFYTLLPQVATPIQISGTYITEE